MKMWESFANLKWDCWQGQSFEVTPQVFDGAPDPVYLPWLTGNVCFVQKKGDLGKGPNGSFPQQQHWLCVLLYWGISVPLAHGGLQGKSCVMISHILLMSLNHHVVVGYLPSSGTMWGSSVHEFPLGVPGQTPKLLNNMFCQDILVCIQWLFKNTIAGTTLHVLHEVVVLGSLMCLNQVFLNILFCAVKVPCFMKVVGKWCWSQALH